jgi:hypothetical protein
MTLPIPVRERQQAYVRDAMLGIELLDAVTLVPVSEGVKVVAEGLHGQPIVNASGIFVWLREDSAPLRKITIDPVTLPYEKTELLPADLTPPLTRVELRPRADYPFAAGVTGIRGTLVEDRFGRAPVRDAEVHLAWLDQNGLWRDAPAPTRTSDRGDFVAVLRLTAAEFPDLDANDELTVRLRARRGGPDRESLDLKLPRGRVADRATFPAGADALLFFWDELQP